MVREERTFFPPRGEACGKAGARRDGTGTRIISRNASRCPEEVKCRRDVSAERAGWLLLSGSCFGADQCQRLHAAGVTDVCRELARRNGAAASGSLK